MCCTFRVAYEAFRRVDASREVPRSRSTSPRCSHANYGGSVGIWRLMDIFDRNQIKATIGANGLAIEKWPDTYQGRP